MENETQDEIGRARLLCIWQNERPGDHARLIASQPAEPAERRRDTMHRNQCASTHARQWNERREERNTTPPPHKTGRKEQDRERAGPCCPPCLSLRLLAVCACCPQARPTQSQGKGRRGRPTQGHMRKQRSNKTRGEGNKHSTARFAFSFPFFSLFFHFFPSPPQPLLNTLHKTGTHHRRRSCSSC